MSRAGVMKIILACQLVHFYSRGKMWTNCEHVVNKWGINPNIFLNRWNDRQNEGISHFEKGGCQEK
jgi:hypothetical protein